MEINILNHHGVEPADVRKEKKKTTNVDLEGIAESHSIQYIGWYGFQFDASVF